MADENDIEENQAADQADKPERDEKQEAAAQAMAAFVDESDASQADQELDLETVFDVPVKISVVLGRTKIPISELLQLSAGKVIELERKVGEPVDVLINDRLVAQGEVVIVEDNIGITMTDIVRMDDERLG